MGFQQIGAAVNVALLAVFRSVSLHDAFSAGFAGHAPMQATADHDRLPQPPATCPAEISETAPLFHSVFSAIKRRTQREGKGGVDEFSVSDSPQSRDSKRSGQVAKDFSPALRQVAAFGAFSTDRSRAGGYGFVQGRSRDPDRWSRISSSARQQAAAFGVLPLFKAGQVAAA
ncbi:hypothetical protein AXF42_Ash017041 [Apostasia shenzhenica]|uniref:Uncharacterized protein n=1 Tax=Apostasia shenzhenica TaxID=1088818 RepID=A0A2I0B7H7_9ASPA|nr:hypothetical protein AXF42_Ash017041 [Apostasia shenzhenica]